MNRFAVALSSVLFATVLCYGQSASSAPAQAAPGHGAFPVKVTKTLDSSKVKEGDKVELETIASFKLADGTLVPKGSKVVGHVAAAKARSKGDSDSQLTLALDKLNIAGGKELALKGVVQAVFPAQEEQDPQMAGAATAGAGGGQHGMGGPGLVTNDKPGSNTNASGSPNPVADPKSVGVQGIHDLELNDGVLTSKGKNVKLSTGVRLVVHVEIFG